MFFFSSSGPQACSAGALPLDSISPFCIGYFIISFSFFGGTGFCTQSFTLARPVLYHLSHSASPFFKFSKYSRAGLSNYQCCGNLKLRYGTLRQISRKQHWLCPHRPSILMSKGWAPRTKGSHLLHPCKQLQKQKTKFNPHMAACDFIGYFILLVLCDHLHVSVFVSFIFLLCHPFPLPHYQNTACLFLFWSSSLLPHSPLWCSDPPRVKGHHLDLGE
jgi:hypothetical protein